ncbi:class I adenylate-forming enzyme family protein [Streptomyces candidus]|uniref:Fatty-acyl-CoA synthase n=1 Tax=Streptomyces candidus TaxID=67283 RepID=A0A7X0HGD9_9ACTN|nr:AMP-binding protein [Streptomyces candidus]MBB6436009.1 fatty-acyl-CoA synthase [Streptomyces candidus]GHH43322.1 acyl-CoA synthetase [Streptomyces candidus]
MIIDIQHTYEQRTYLDHVLEHWHEDEDAEVLVQGTQRLTGGEARRRLFRLGHALRRQGLAPGDGVGLFLANRVDSVLVQLAVHLIGCRVVFLPPEPGPGELAALVEQSGARVVVTDPLFAQRAAAAAGRSVHAPVLLGLGPCEEQCADLLALEAECPAVRPEHVPAPGTDEAVTVLYTGGTLGRPKLAAHSHRLYDALVDLTKGDSEDSGPTAFLAAPPASLPDADTDAVLDPTTDPVRHRVLAATLLTHGSGHLTAIQALVTGSVLVVLPEFDAGAALKVLREERITAVMFVPPMLYALLDHPRCEPGALPALRRVVVGGAATSPTRLQQGVDVLGPVLSQGYGQSEALGITAFGAEDLSSEGARRPELWRSCGRAISDTEIEIRAEGSATSLPVGRIGEVCVRGRTVMLGYYEDPERTAEALHDGWLRTGDMGYLDAEGYLYLVDRAKDIIVTGSTSDNVYSRVLEDFLLTMPGVRDAAAVGVPDEEYGEAVQVFLATAEGADVDPEAVGAAVSAELGELYAPRRTVLLDRLPTTNVGKVDKKALRAAWTHKVSPDMP